MGNSAEENRHEEAMKQINNKRELEIYIEKNNLQKFIAQSEREKKMDLFKHEEVMEELSIKREDMQLKYENQRKDNEEKHEIEKQKISYNHNERMKELENESQKNKDENLLKT